MAKIPFDMKYRPQIESGEYKVETRAGNSVRIVCWNAEGNLGELISLIKQGNNEVTCRYYRSGSYLSNAEHSLDLFIITPEPEMSEFEKEVYKMVTDKVHSKDCASRLLNLARKEIEKEQKPTAEEILTKAGLKPYKDGNQWCILVGDNIQEGICGFGNTIDEAIYQFLTNVLEQQKEQEQPEVDLNSKVTFDCIIKKVTMSVQELINYYIDKECCDAAVECGF